MSLPRTTIGFRRPWEQCGDCISKRPRMRRRSRCAVRAARFFDVAVDIRRDCSTYGQWACFKVSAQTCAQLCNPSNFARGFVTLEADIEIVYKCSDYSAPEAEDSLRWDDSTIRFDWPIVGGAILSDKDANVPLVSNR